MKLKYMICKDYFRDDYDNIYTNVCNNSLNFIKKVEKLLGTFDSTTIN